MDYKNKSLRKRATIGIASGLAAVTVIGSAVALSSAAGAATSTPSASSTPSTSAPKSFNPGGSTPMRSDEKSVSTSVSDTLSAAALKAVPGATIIRVETDAGDAAYEVHLKTSDGTLKTVKFDKNYNVTKVEAGMGLGDPMPNGGPGGHQPPSGTAPSGQAPTGTFPGGAAGSYNGA
jgi:hypothetical protein